MILLARQQPSLMILTDFPDSIARHGVGMGWGLSHVQWGGALPVYWVATFIFYREDPWRNACSVERNADGDSRGIGGQASGPVRGWGLVLRAALLQSALVHR